MLDDAAKLAVRTAVLVATQDRVTPPPNARRIFEAVPPQHRRLYREIPEAGHAVCQEQPAEVATIIDEFIASKASAHA
jgi:pimeloyl-ACP methyl ester carboxylesterase